MMRSSRLRVVRGGVARDKQGEFSIPGGSSCSAGNLIEYRPPSGDFLTPQQHRLSKIQCIGLYNEAVDLRGWG
jgi:hypothetical protein